MLTVLEVKLDKTGQEGHHYELEKEDEFTTRALALGIVFVEGGTIERSEVLNYNLTGRQKCVQFLR